MIKIYEDVKNEVKVDYIIGGPGKHYAAYFFKFPPAMSIELDVLVYGIPNEVYYPWPLSSGEDYDDDDDD